jgi:hypothetical protein
MKSLFIKYWYDKGVKIIKKKIDGFLHEKGCFLSKYSVA